MWKQDRLIWRCQRYWMWITTVENKFCSTLFPKRNRTFISCLSFGEECRSVNFGPNAIWTECPIIGCLEKSYLVWPRQEEHFAPLSRLWSMSFSQRVSFRWGGASTHWGGSYPDVVQEGQNAPPGGVILYSAPWKMGRLKLHFSWCVILAMSGNCFT